MNMSKSIIMDFNVPVEMRGQLSAFTVAPWDRCVKYLGIKLVDSLDLSMLIELNLKPIINSA